MKIPFTNNYKKYVATIVRGGMCYRIVWGDLGFPKYSFRIQKGRTLQSSPKYSIQFG
jgi:hypothetical protein